MLVSMPSFCSAFSRDLVAKSIKIVIGASDGGLCSNPELSAIAVHINQRQRVIKVYDHGGAVANVG
jgi:hypothetical protein